ncbi:hypothetical protein [Pandoraea sp.]|uniref:hypothetical protein n=1 Tax=Pandoraea sp. TaxID=1883445 RepID=UPI0035AE2D0B
MAALALIFMVETPRNDGAGLCRIHACQAFVGGMGTAGIERNVPQHVALRRADPPDIDTVRGCARRSLAWIKSHDISHGAF